MQFRLSNVQYFEVTSMALRLSLIGLVAIDATVNSNTTSDSEFKLQFIKYILMIFCSILQGGNITTCIHESLKSVSEPSWNELFSDGADSSSLLFSGFGL